MPDDGLEEGDLSELADASPDTVIPVRYGELRALQEHAQMLEESLRDAKIDQDEMISILGLQPLGQVTPHEVNLMIMEVLKRLMGTERLVKEAENELRERVASGLVPTMDLGNGQKAVQVGRRLPPGTIRGQRRR